MIDGDNPFKPEADEKRVQSLLWDGIAKAANDSIEQSGWVSSISGKPFTKEEMDEYSANVAFKLKKQLKSDYRVLEIGVASGLTCEAIAPYVLEYYGFDVSRVTLDRTKERLFERGITNVIFGQYDAAEIDNAGITNIDCVIINSVAQYFPGYNYFLDVIKKCISICKGNAILYVGDILNYDSMELFEKELKKTGGKGRNRRDLWYSEKLLEALPTIFPEIESIDISRKIGKIDNELKKYRIDLLVSIRKNKRTVKSKREVYPYSLKWSDILKVAREYGDVDFWEVLNGKNSV